MKYNRALMMAVLRDRIRIAKAVKAPQGYADFDRGVAAAHFIGKPRSAVEIIQKWLAPTLIVMNRRTPDGGLGVSAPRLGIMGMSHAFEQNTVAPLDPGDRWRLFAVAARGSAVKSAQDVDLYAAQLHARRALALIHMYTHDRKWLQRTDHGDY
jgi:hypothetical protein